MRSVSRFIFIWCPAVAINVFPWHFIFLIQRMSIIHSLGSVQWLSRVQLCNSMDFSTPGFPVHHLLLELAQTHVHRVGDAIQPSHPLLPPSPPSSIFASIRVFSNESALHIRWPKYWDFSFSISPSNEYSGLISFDCTNKTFDCVDHNKLWKILKEMGIPDHLTCLLRNLYAGKEATVRTGHGTTDCFQIGKGVRQG